MDPLDPRHGTYAGAQAHSRTKTPLCEPCQNARTRYQKRLDLDHTRGHRRRIDPTPAIQHARQLINTTNVTIQWIANQAGIHHHTLANILTQPSSRLVERRVVNAILNVAPPADTRSRDGYLPRLGAVRRLRALMALGWPRDHIADIAGIHPTRLSTLNTGSRGQSPRRDEWVTASTWHRINHAYQQLGNTPGPSAATRRRAESLGWATPWAYDDIDNPNERPRASRARTRADDIDHAVIERVLSGEWRLKTTTAERRIIVRRWLDQGGTLGRLTVLTGWRVERYNHEGDAA